MSKDKKHSGGKIFVIVLCCILVFAIGGGALFANFVLNKLDYSGSDVDDGMLDSIIQSEGITLPADFGFADSDIADNISDTRLWYHDDVINILLLGLDYAEIEGKKYPRSDAVILVSLNKADGKINMVSLSRATYVAIPGYKNARLNAAYSYGGPSLLVKTVELNYKIRIDNYAAVNFNAFTQIIDILGGVSVNLTSIEARAMLTVLGSSYKGAGYYNLNGEQALSYARLRGIDSDRNRTQRQQNILLSIADKAKSSISADVVLKLINDILPLVKTDFTKMELVSQAVNALNYLKWPITRTLIPTEQPKKDENFIVVEESEVIMLDWAKTRDQIHELLYPDIELKKRAS